MSKKCKFGKCDGSGAIFVDKKSGGSFIPCECIAKHLEKKVVKLIKHPFYKHDMEAKKVYGHDTHLAEQLKLAKKHWEKVLFPEAHKIIMENKKHDVK